MLVSFSTQSARVKRKGGALLVLPVAVIEQAAAAARAAEHSHSPLVLLIDATKPLLYSLDVFVATLLMLGRSSSAPITVAVYCGPTHVAAEQALEAGAQLIIPEQRHSLEQYVSLLSWCAQRAAAQEADVVAAPLPSESLEQLLPLLETVRVSGLFVSEEILQVENVFNPVLIKNFLTLAKMPILVELHRDHMPRSLKYCRKAGIGGFVIAHEVNQAFTAGIRTSLRDRTQYNPTQYLAQGSLAVEERISHYFETVCLT